ncbi:MAG: peroxiredoxin [Candidatus Hydrogenedentes bacterium]|nr:peroxiredoxin [Candidatus Hydrogenedentota bacterium]
MLTRIQIAVCAVFALSATVAALAEDKSKETLEAPKVGDQAPDFALPKAKEEAATQGDSIPQKLSDFQGKKNVLIAFYPKADTPGCTKQLCGYRDDIEKLQGIDTEVIAISTDEQKDSDLFRDKFTMPFTVLGNPDQAIVKAYGVPLMERGENQYAQRSVFLVDKEGVLRYIDLEYDIAADKEPLYAAMESLNDSNEADG